MYADDTTSAVSCKNFDDMCHFSSVSNGYISDWMKASLLTLNVNKTVNVCFSLRSHQDWGSQSHCFLGVVLDSRLLWHPHVDKIATVISKNIFLLRNLKFSVDKRILLMVFHATFQSRIAYGLLVWGHAPAADRIFALQRRAIRVVADIGYRDDCRSSFVLFGVLTLPCLYILQCLIFVHKNISKFTFRNEVHDLDTRSRNNLHVTFHRLSKTKNGTNYWGAHFYNKLPMHIRSLNSLEFKKSVKTFLINKCYYSYKEFLKDNVLF